MATLPGNAGGTAARSDLAGQDRAVAAVPPALRRWPRPPGHFGFRHLLARAPGSAPASRPAGAPDREGRRPDVVGPSPTPGAVVRFLGAVLVEQSEARTVSHRHPGV